MSKIEWTDETWNPVIGCTRVSEGCRNCYAETMAARLTANPVAKDYDDIAHFEDEKGARWTGKVKCLPGKLEDPLRWRKPRKVFVNSMSDLFHEDVSFEFIAGVFGVMESAPNHTFQVLTKRPERAAKFFHWLSAQDWPIELHEAATRLSAQNRDKLCQRVLDTVPDKWPLPNVWLGTSVENQDAADQRIPHLLRCPAAVRFLSCEPLIGPVDLAEKRGWFQTGTPYEPVDIDWIIAGGESGPNARPMHPDWPRQLRDQCEAAGVPFFFKQWGEYSGDPSSADKPDVMVGTYGQVWHEGDVCDFADAVGAAPMAKIGKSDAGRELDGQTHDAFPEVET